MLQYLKRTWKNKMIALLLLVVSLVPIWLEGDATMLVLMSPVVIALFCANQNYIK